jgi:hypothetical protein
MAQDWIDQRVCDALGISPNDCWDADTAASPLAQLTQTDLAAFLPVSATRRIQGGAVFPQFDRQVFAFRAPELFAELGDGYQLTVRFDPCEPSLGAAIYNAETRSSNHRAYQEGQLIGWAPFEEFAPQLDLRENPEPNAGVAAQRRFHRTAFRATPRPGQPVVRIASVRDGRGNVATVGAAPATAVRVPAPSPAPDAPVDERLDTRPEPIVRIDTGADESVDARTGRAAVHDLDTDDQVESISIGSRSRAAVPSHHHELIHL